MKEFSVEELATYNGAEGRPIYIAHLDKVYDVSGSKLWRNGQHMKRHQAGRDLTTDIQAAPHEPDVLERYPQVGILRKEIEERKLPPALLWLLQKFPMLRRHPHPMTVHFPIVFAFGAPVFMLLYLISGVRSFESTSLHCLAGGILFSAVGISTGIYTWWLNYLAKPLRAVKIKIPLTCSMLIVETVVFIWRVLQPDVIDSVHGNSIIYVLLMLSLIPMITVIGWFGASMTFPVERQ